MEGPYAIYGYRGSNALWEDRITTKKSIGTSPYQLVYGMDVVFPSSLGVLVMKLIQELQVETNDIQRSINQTIHLQQTREEFYIKSQIIQDKIKKFFDKKTKEDYFYIREKVLKWDSRREDKGKNGKFDFLRRGPFVMSFIQTYDVIYVKLQDFFFRLQLYKIIIQSNLKSSMYM